MHADAIIYHNYFKSPNLALHQTRHIHVRAGRCDPAWVPAQAPPAAGAPGAATGQGGHGAGWEQSRVEMGSRGSFCKAGDPWREPMVVQNASVILTAQARSELFSAIRNPVLAFQG